MVEIVKQETPKPITTKRIFEITSEAVMPKRIVEIARDFDPSFIFLSDLLTNLGNAFATLSLADLKST
jgi:hypothetical protein